MQLTAWHGMVQVQLSILLYREMKKWSHKKGTPLKNENRVIKVGFWS